MLQILFFTFILLSIYSPSVVIADDSFARDMHIQKEMDRITQSQEIVQPVYPVRDSKKVHTFSVAHQVFYSGFSKYKRSNVKGDWQGFEGRYIFRPPQGNILNNPVTNFYSLEGLYARGKNTKTGVYTPDFLTIKNIPATMYEVRALIGRDFNASDKFRFTPYTGYGFRIRTDKASGHRNVLSDGIPPDATPVGGYDQVALYHYIPLGLTTEYIVKDDYEITFNMEYDFFIKGRTKYHLTDLDSYLSEYYSASFSSLSYEDIRVNQRKGFGLRSSLKFLKHFSAVDLYFEPFVRYWNLKTSKSGSGYLIGDPGYRSQNTLKEEKNYTLEGGLKTGVQF